MSVAAKSTFSIVAADPDAGEVGVAVQSKYFAVGAVVPWAKAGVGAVATQAAGVAAFGPRVLGLLGQGRVAADSIRLVLAEDAGRETRQLAAVTAAGVAAAHTGSECNEWAGHETGEGFAVQGNILAGPAVVREMARAFQESNGTLAERLVTALEAGQAAGGDRRGQQSAALVVERAGAGTDLNEGIDRVADLRVDDHPEPIAELRRLLGIHARWDVLRRAFAHHSAGRFAEGADVLAAGLERFPDDPLLLYDLACYEARAGRGDDALEHLARSIALEPAHVETARGDADFAGLADDERFRSLVRR